MINILHSKIKDQEILIQEKNLLIKNLKEELEIKSKIINLQDKQLFKKLWKQLKT